MQSVKGSVTSGLGEGKKFLSMHHYQDQIKKELGFEVFPGTLNVRSTNKVDLSKEENIRIAGFEKEGKKLGGASCYKARIQFLEGAIIVPDINKHENDDILEFISAENMRKKLNLHDGDEVEIELQ